jgi:hypothetical protein
LAQVLDFILYSSRWKNRFVDHRGVLVDFDTGNPVYLSFIVCPETHKSWAQVFDRPAQPSLIAQQLQALNPEGGPVRVIASAEVRQQLSALCGPHWKWLVPQSGGVNAAIPLRRFEHIVRDCVGCILKGYSGAYRLEWMPKVTTQIGDKFWCNQFTLAAWNEALLKKSEFLLPHYGALRKNDQEPLHQIVLELKNLLYEAQVRLPELEAVEDDGDDHEEVALDGEDNYPRSVHEALTQWSLAPETLVAVKRVPWAEVAQRIYDQEQAIERFLPNREARSVVSKAYGCDSWDDLVDALELIEEWAVWDATFPPFKVWTEDDREWELSVARDHAVSAFFGVSPNAPPYHLRMPSLMREFLRSHHPVADFELADANQLVACCRVLSRIQDRSLPDSLFWQCAAVILGMQGSELDAVVKWHADKRGRKEGSYALTPQALRQANSKFWEALGNAPGRWLRLQELDARLRGSEPWSRSYYLDGIASPALVAQACLGADVRVLLSSRPRQDETGPYVKAVVCSSSMVPKLDMAGWTLGTSRFSHQIRQAVIRDTGPLPARNCSLLTSELAEDDCTRDDVTGEPIPDF